jgi:4-nitrophenyl phosphatase
MRSSMLEGIKAVVLDMDGVLWRGDAPLPGLEELFALFRARSIPFVMATNNSTSTVQAYVKKLARFGVFATPANIVTSAVATAEYLKSTYGDGLRVHVLGEPSLHQVMLEFGFLPVMMNADIVVAGMDRDLTYEKLRRATYLIREGARFIGTNGDLTFPMPDGGVAPGAGSILAALEAATDQVPFIVGKPEQVMFEMALARLGVSAGQVLMVGDRLETDILGAQRAGLKTALVWTGVTTPEMLAASEIKPDIEFDGIGELRQKWAGLPVS